jgi:hypothetical protein
MQMETKRTPARPSAFVLRGHDHEVVPGILTSRDTVFVLDMPADLVDVDGPVEIVVVPARGPAERLQSSSGEAHRIGDGPLLGMFRLDRPCEAAVPPVREITVDDLESALARSPDNLSEALRLACPDIVPPGETPSAQELAEREISPPPPIVRPVTHPPGETAMGLCGLLFPWCVTPPPNGDQPVLDDPEPTPNPGEPQGGTPWPAQS